MNKTLRQLIIILIITSSFSCSQKSESEGKIENMGRKITLSTDYDKYFIECQTSGSFLIFDLNSQRYITNDTSEIRRTTVPASTFKIINLLIALETEAIKDEKEIIKWPGYIDTDKYGFRQDIWRDMTVEDAFKKSAGWVFIELAKRVGREKYKHYLNLCKYGNQDLSEQDVDFWNFGAMGITPINQIDFLRAVYEETLPFSKENFKILKRVMLTEETENYKIRGKTGWAGRKKGLNIGWWVGYIESKNNVTFFATRLIQERRTQTANFGECRKKITKNIISELNLFNLNENKKSR